MEEPRRGKGGSAGNDQHLAVLLTTMIKNFMKNTLDIFKKKGYALSGVGKVNEPGILWGLVAPTPPFKMTPPPPKDAPARFSD
jgi:hypothetical protein